jgi:hypothetical protein
MPKPPYRFTKAQVKELFGVDLVTPKGKQPRKLTAAELQDHFGISPMPKLRKKQKRRAATVDELFSDMLQVYGVASITVFRAAAEQMHFEILRTMSECPEFVISYMQGQLTPERVEAHRQKQVKKLRAAIASTERNLRRLT